MEQWWVSFLLQLLPSTTPHDLGYIILRYYPPLASCYYIHNGQKKQFHSEDGGKGHSPLPYSNNLFNAEPFTTNIHFDTGITQGSTLPNERLNSGAKISTEESCIVVREARPKFSDHGHASVLPTCMPPKHFPKCWILNSCQNAPK